MKAELILFLLYFIALSSAKQPSLWAAGRTESEAYSPCSNRCGPSATVEILKVDGSIVVAAQEKCDENKVVKNALAIARTGDDFDFVGVFKMLADTVNVLPEPTRQWTWSLERKWSTKDDDETELPPASSVGAHDIARMIALSSMLTVETEIAAVLAFAQTFLLRAFATYMHLRGNYCADFYETHVDS
jgi:hypothetical protein